MRSVFDPATANYFISLALSISLDNFIHTHSFASLLYPDFLRSCASVSVRNPLPSQLKRDLKLNVSSTRESFVIELMDCFSYSYAHLSHKSQSFNFSLYIPPTRRARPESLAFSDYAGDRAPTVAWAPTCQRCGGDVLSLCRLCVAPGWLDWRRFCISFGFSRFNHGLLLTHSL
ncbi:hypothetical protein DFH06DRAFT_147379 [Mycena polygramma]|nr:hypothetical protein DFH06DRAFT_147379 [Mycena polygramma]